MKKKLVFAFAKIALVTIFLYSCQKDIDHPNQQQSEEAGVANNNNQHGHLQQTKTFSSDVVVSWINLQLQMNKAPLPAGTAGQANDRCMAYCGIATYEAVVPGMSDYQTLNGQLKD